MGIVGALDDVRQSYNNAFMPATAEKKTVPATKNFRINLRKVMEREGISQRELADRADLTFTHINRIIVGKSKNPSLDVCERLAKKVGLTLADLIVDPNQFE
jgi:DNA-binding XRE family transcriptional regulator